MSVECRIYVRIFCFSTELPRGSESSTITKSQELNWKYHHLPTCNTWHIYLCVYIYILHICLYIFTHIFVYIFICIYTFVYIFTHTYLHILHIYMSIYIYTYILCREHTWESFLFMKLPEPIKQRYKKGWNWPNVWKFWAIYFCTVIWSIWNRQNMDYYFSRC